MQAMFTPQPSVFVDRVMTWIAHRRPASLPAHLLATHTRLSTDAVQCVRLRHRATTGAATPTKSATTTTTTTTPTTPTTPPVSDNDCALNPSRVADTFDTLHAIVLAMNAFGEKYHDEIIAMNAVAVPDL